MDMMTFVQGRTFRATEINTLLENIVVRAKWDEKVSPENIQMLQFYVDELKKNSKEHENSILNQNQIDGFLQGLKNRQKTHKILCGMSVASLQKCIDDLKFIDELNNQQAEPQMAQMG